MASTATPSMRPSAAFTARCPSSWNTVSVPATVVIMLWAAARVAHASPAEVVNLNREKGLVIYGSIAISCRTAWTALLALPLKRARLRSKPLTGFATFLGCSHPGVVKRVEALCDATNYVKFPPLPAYFPGLEPSIMRTTPRPLFAQWKRRASRVLHEMEL